MTQVLSMNRLVAQAFEPAGLPDFRVRWTRNARLESRPDPQARKPALRTRLGSWSQCAPNMTWRLSINLVAADVSRTVLDQFCRRPGGRAFMNNGHQRASCRQGRHVE